MTATVHCCDARNPLSLDCAPVDNVIKRDFSALYEKFVNTTPYKKLYFCKETVRLLRKSGQNIIRFYKTCRISYTTL